MATVSFAQELENANSTSSPGIVNYADRSSLELRQLRAQIDAVAQATPLAGQAALAPYINALEVAEQALADFKTASTLELDRRQNDLEKAKARIAQLWTDYRAAHSTAGLRPAPTESLPVDAAR